MEKEALDMPSGNRFSERQTRKGVGYPESLGDGTAGNRMHPAWLAFVQFCEELRYGEIECLKIQDGLPVLAEVTKKKVKFT